MNTEEISESNIQSLMQIATQKQKSGELDEAETIYKQILQTQPERIGESSLRDLYHLVMLNFGYLRHQQGKLTEAINIYQQILRVDPNFVQAHNNLGNVLQDKGELEAAINCYKQVLSIKPDFAHAYNNLGNIFLLQSKVEAAIDCYKQALSIKPDLADAHNNLGNALQEHDLEAAIQSYQQALSIKPEWADPYYNLGTVFHEKGQLEAAIASYQQALKIQPDYAAAKFGICMHQLPVIYSSVDEIQIRRNQYHQHLQELADYYESASDKEQAEAAKVVGYLQPFYLPYQCLNDRVLQQIYGKMICQIMAKRYPQWSQSMELPKLAVNEKIRVGFISGFFRDHAIWRVPIKGWVENIDRSEFELFGYHTGSIRDQETVKAAKTFDKFTQGPLVLEQWAEVIEHDRLHVLIFPEFGLDPMTIRLGCLRLAPIQITTWGHANTSGLPTMDYYLGSELMEPENAQDHYTEKLVRFPNLSIHYTPIEIEPQAISKTDIGIAEDDIMFWCCQSLFKYLPQNDDVFPKIAQALARCKFVFFKHFSDQQITEVFRERLRRAFEDLGLNYQDYCIFLPPSKIRTLAGKEIRTFTAVAAIADIYLDSIDWSGFNTTFEAIAHHIPIVTLPGNLMRGRPTMAMLNMMGIEEMIATSKEDYVQIAVRLAQDAQYRQYISRQLAENKQKLYGDLKPISALEDFLLGVFNKSRRFGLKEVTQVLQLAVQHQRTHRFADAEQLYLQVLSKQPNHPEALYGLGILAQQMGQLETAEQWLSAASEVQPDSVKIWFSLGNVHQARGQWSEAQEAYQRAIALRPDAAPIYNNLGYTLQQQGLFDEAIAYYQKAVEIEPNCVEADVNLGNTLQAQGKLSPEKQIHYAQLNHKLGVARKNAGDMKMAVAYYNQAIAIQPDLVDAHYNLGVALQQQGDLEAAIACYQKALKFNPQHSEAIASLGQIYQTSAQAKGGG